MSTVLQTCKRCRKRRIKCDTNKLGCHNCSLADTECIFYDEALKEDIPRRYCHSLQARLEELQCKIKAHKNTGDLSLLNKEAGTDLARQLGQDYHLISSNGLSLSSISTTYIGCGSSARIMEQLLTALGQWHVMHTSPQRDHSVVSFVQKSSSIADSALQTKFPTRMTHQKTDLASILMPSTQKSLIEHFLRVIQPEYPILSIDQETALLERLNPLQWANSNSDHPDSLVTTSVLLIGSALAARDLDSTLSSTAELCQKSFNLAYRGSWEAKSHDSIERLMYVATAVCFAVILELVKPTSNQIWGLLGRGIENMEQLHAQYQITQREYDERFRRLQYTFLKLEGCIARHLRQHSRIFDMWPVHEVNNMFTTNNSLESLGILAELRKISQAFYQDHAKTKAHFQNLIPHELRLKPGAMPSCMSMASSTLYLALHPLFTSKIDNILGGHPVETAADVIQLVANAALAKINTCMQTKREAKIISIWLTAEQVLEAGAVWAVYLIILRRTQTFPGGLASIGTSAAMNALTKCSALLSSFAERWKEGTTYVEVWESFLSLLWGVIE